MIPPCARYVLLSSGLEARVSSVTAQPRFAASQAAAKPPRPLPITRTSVWIASFIWRTLCRLYLETQIHCGGVMRQRANRNPVHACLGKLPDVRKRDSTGSFRTNFSCWVVRFHMADCLAYQIWTHI